MDYQGYIQLHRKLLDWEWYTNIPTKTLFIHLLLKANHKDGNWRGIPIKRGQHLTSIKTLSDETGLSIKQIRNSIKNLEKTKELGKQTASLYTLLSVLNYDIYQTEGKQRANEGQGRGKRRATNNNDNNNNTDNKYIPEPKISDKERTFKFLKFFNESLFDKNGKIGQFKTLSKTDLNNLKKLRENYISHEDWITAFKAMVNSPWVIENSMATPAHYLRNENFQKYLNAGNQSKKFKAPWD